MQFRNNMATSEEIQIGIALEKEIRDLKYFSKCIHDAAANFDIDRKAIINIETEKRFSIFGSHSFGCGRHQTTVNVPKSLIDLSLIHI